MNTIRVTLLTFALATAACAPSTASSTASSTPPVAADAVETAAVETAAATGDAGGTATAETATVTGGEREPVPIPTVAEGHPGHDVLLVGVLRGDPHLDGGGCLWVEAQGSGARTAVRWPNGYAARFGPVELLDATGGVVAREGELLALGGSGPMAGELERCRMDGTAFGAWVVEPAADFFERVEGGDPSG